MYGICPQFAVLAGYNVKIVRLKMICNRLSAHVEFICKVLQENGRLTVAVAVVSAHSLRFEDVTSALSARTTAHKRWIDIIIIRLQSSYCQKNITLRFATASHTMCIAGIPRLLDRCST